MVVSQTEKAFPPAKEKKIWFCKKEVFEIFFGGFIMMATSLISVNVIIFRIGKKKLVNRRSVVFSVTIHGSYSKNIKNKTLHIAEKMITDINKNIVK